MAHLDTTPGASRSARGGSLDLLRFLAALFIVFYHYASSAPVDLTTVHPAFTRGYLATDFFLILSGYVLAISYGPRLASGETSAGQFLWRRMRRIWPGHLVVMAAFALVFMLAVALGHPPKQAADFQPRDFFAQLLLLQALGFQVGRGWNFPTWSLSALIFCYAGFAFAWRTVARLSGAAAVAIGLLAVLGFDLFVTRVLGLRLFELPFYLGLLRAPPFFLAGLGLARMVSDKPINPVVAGPVGALALALLVGLQRVGRMDMLSVLLIAVAILACGSMRNSRTSPVIAYAAKLSFALFLTHILTAVLWFNLVTPRFAEASEPVRWLAWGLAIPVALFNAALFHHLVDEPLQRLISYGLGRWNAARVSAGVRLPAE